MSRKAQIPSYRFHKPSGQAVVTIQGRDYYLGIYDSLDSREAYRRLLAEHLASGAPPISLSTSQTVSEVAERYLVHARAYYRSAPHIDRVERAVAAAVNLYGSTRAIDFGPIALQAVRQTMIDGKTLNRRSINQRVDIIRLMFRWAAAQQYVPASVPDALYQVDRLKARARNIGVREPEDVPPAPKLHIEAALKHVFSPVAAMIQVQLLTAMRPGEVVPLTQAELNRSGVIQLAKGETLELAGVWIYEPEKWKMAHTGDRRIILFGPRAQEILKPFLDRPVDVPLFSPIEALAERSQRRRMERRTPVYQSHTRYYAALKPAAPARPACPSYTVASYRRAIWYACTKANVTPWHPHQLRHNATDLLVEQFGWDVARIVLGHRSIDTTRIYARDDLVKAAEAMRKAG